MGIHINLILTRNGYQTITCSEKTSNQTALQPHIISYNIFGTSSDRKYVMYIVKKEDLLLKLTYFFKSRMIFILSWGRSHNFQFTCYHKSPRAMIYHYMRMCISLYIDNIPNYHHILPPHKALLFLSFRQWYASLDQFWIECIRSKYGNIQLIINTATLFSL